MKRIFSDGQLSIDLDNIKAIRSKSFGRSLSGEEVTIEFLTGKEYVRHIETGEVKLMESQLKIGFSTSEGAASFIETLEDAWNEYLFHRDLKNFA